MDVRAAAYGLAKAFPAVTRAALWAATRPMLAMPPPLRPKGRPLGGIMDAVDYWCPVRCEHNCGATMIVPWQDDQGREIYERGVYEPESVRCFSGLLRPGMTVIDVGAHMGQYSLVAASRGCHVYAFEGVPRTFQWLARNFRINDVKTATAYNRAVSDSDEPVTFRISAARDTGSSSIAAPGWVDSGKTATVPAVTLDAFLAGAGSLGAPGWNRGKVDVVKIDVEGWELPVLRGAESMLREMRPTLMLEFEDERQRLAGTSCAALAAHLRERGYRLQRIGAELTDYDPAAGEKSVNVLATAT